MARTDYGAILSTVIKDTSDAIREVNGTSSLIAPNGWGSAIRTMHSDSDYENVIDQLIEETASGSIASFSDGANDIPLKSLTCTLNPVQDLHGQDYPYPSGGSKNELPMSISDMKSFNTTGTWNGNAYTLNGVTFSVLTDSANNITGIKVNGTATAEANFDISTYSLKAGTSKKINGTSTQPSDTTIAYGFRGYGNVSANADRTMTRDASAGDWNNYVYIKVYQGYNAQNLMYYPMIRDASINDGTFAPYSNICPITGHTELNLVHAGKNLLPFKSGIDFTINGVRFYTSNGNLYLDGTANASISSLSQDFIDNFNFYLPKGTYHFERNNVGYFSMYIKPIGVDANIIANSGTATLTSGTNAYLGMYIVSGKTFSNTLIPCQLEIGSSATTYEAYTGTTTTTDFSTTVYGGVLDPVSGVLTVKWKAIKFSDISWAYDSQYRRMSSETISDIKGASTEVVRRMDFMCSCYQVISDGRALANVPDKSIYWGGVDNRRFYVHDSNYTDTTTWLAQFQNEIIAYELATPTTTQLTPEQLNSILGDNNFYHDGNGEIQVVYKANGELYVQQHS